MENKDEELKCSICEEDDPLEQIAEYYSRLWNVSKDDIFVSPDGYVCTLGG